MPSQPSLSFARARKIQLPRFRAGLITRGDLGPRLDEALRHSRLVLLIAAAGYGKTVALSRQLADLGPGSVSAWVTADEQDHLPRLLACLADALEAHDPPWRVAPLSLVERASKETELHAVVDELANVLAAMPAAHGVMAFDDMHLVSDPRVFEFLQLLIDRAPHNWTFALAARTPLPLRLARLRARRELAEFGPADLSFNLHEVRQLWSAAGKEEDEPTVQDLLERTQGWVAGLCLTLDILGRKGAPAKGRRLSQRHLFEYLASEVFERMSVSWREFLMRCAVLPELTATRCAKISGNSHAARMLAEIEQRGIFISVLDGEELTLRLHDLFRDFLNDRLRREHPDEVPALLRRAAEDETDPARRMDMLLRAGAWHEAEDLLCELAPILLADGETAQVTRLIDQFPADARNASPRLAFVRGLLAFCSLYPQTAAHMDDAARGFEREGDVRGMWRARAHQAYGYLSFPQPDSAARADEILAALERIDTTEDPETELAKHSCLYWRALIHGPSAKVETHLQDIEQRLRHAPPALWFRFFPWPSQLTTPGVHALTERLAAGALAAAGDSHLPLQLLARNAEAGLLFWDGRLDEAKALIRRLREDELWAGRPPISRFGSWLVADAIDTLRGRPLRLQAAGTDHQVLSGRLPRTALGTMGIVGMAAGKVDMLESAVEGFENSGDMQGSFWLPFLPLFKARIALAAQRQEQALPLLRESVRTCGEVDRFGLDAMVRIFLAIAEMRAGRAQPAWDAVQPLVRRILRSAAVTNVLLCGTEALAELARAPWPRSAAPEDLAEIQRWARLSKQLATGAPAAGAEAEAAAGAALHADGVLSARELEVLERIAAGDSNKLIARALDLSPHTVKRHVARILERLDLSSRGEAAAWYHRRSADAPGG